MIQDKSTSEVEELLAGLKTERIGEFLKENRDYMANGKKAFYYFMKDTIESKNIRLKDLYRFAGLSESYGGQIIRMEKHTAERDLILRLCIAGHFSLKETERALKLYEMAPLYAKDPRDACLIVAVNRRIYDIFEIDRILTSAGFEKLK